MSMDIYPVRRLRKEEYQTALDLMWEVFLEFVAKKYQPEGVETFRAYLSDREKTDRLTWYGAFDGETLVGTLCMREPHHIGGFFVRGAYHRRGIGRALFEAMKRDDPSPRFTVNSSPYAVDIYRRLGFFPTDSEQIADGIRFTPMRYDETEKHADTDAVVPPERL